ncbi:MAG: glycosyltransferase [Proteobacteria bacterium]|nr:glycosyltransferase [Pseudomonadota bacterium]
MTTPNPIVVLRLIARLNLGGPAKHVTWLLREMDPAVFRQTLVCGQVEPGEDDMTPLIRAAGVEPVVVPTLGRSLHPVRDAKSLLACLEILVRTKPDLVHTHTSKAGFVGRAAAFIYNLGRRLAFRPPVRVVHTFHGHTFHSYFGRLRGGLFLRIERLLARLATDRIVAISRRQYEEIHLTYGVGRPGQMVVIPLGVDTSLWDDPAPGRDFWRRRFDFQEDEIVVGAVGRVAPVKNYGLLVDAAAALREVAPEHYERCRFVLIGGGPPDQTAALTRRAEEAGVGNRFRLLGPLVDPENFFPGLDAVLLTSDNEGTPLSLIEGLAAGRPVVATAVGGVPDVVGPQLAVQDGFSVHHRGLLAAPRDAVGLARGLACLMDPPDLAARLGALGRRHVRLTYDKSRLAADLGRLYHELIRT